MNCQKCKSDRIMIVSGKCSDLCYSTFKGSEKDGYVPCGVGIDNGEDYIHFGFCLECGQIQGDFPRPDPDFANQDEE